MTNLVGTGCCNYREGTTRTDTTKEIQSLLFHALLSITYKHDCNSQCNRSLSCHRRTHILICFMVVRNCLGQWFSDLRVHQDHLKDVLKETLGLKSRISGSVSLGRKSFGGTLEFAFLISPQVSLTLLV